MKLASLVEYVDDYLRIPDFPDYPNAYNGLQVQGPAEVRSICAAVDASEAAINAAAAHGNDLLLVHHGLFWDGAAPVTGRRFRKLTALLRGELGLYSAHLPLDAHPEVGNCALLARALNIEIDRGFGSCQGADVGWIGTTSETRESLRDRLEKKLQVPVRLIDGGSDNIHRVAVVTGAGGSMIAEAAASGADALVTGEGAHHTYFDAMEYGINVYYAGHYATETLGVRALASHLEARFGIPWEFSGFSNGFVGAASPARSAPQEAHHEVPTVRRGRRRQVLRGMRGGRPTTGLPLLRGSGPGRSVVLHLLRRTSPPPPAGSGKRGRQESAPGQRRVRRRSDHRHGVLGTGTG